MGYATVVIQPGAKEGPQSMTKIQPIILVPDGGRMISHQPRDLQPKLLVEQQLS